MSRRKKNKNKNKNIIKEEKKNNFLKFDDFDLHPETKKSVWAIVFIGTAVIFVLASFNNAGPAGNFLYGFFAKLFGWGYYLFPVIFLIIAGVFLTSERRKLYKVTFLGAILFVLAGLGLIDIFAERGGLMGKIVGSVEILFGYIASIIILGVVSIAAFLITLNLPIKIRRKDEEEEAEEELEIAGISVTGQNKDESEEEKIEQGKEVENEEEIKEESESVKVKDKIIAAMGIRPKQATTINRPQVKNYVFPPLDLLKSSIEKPTVGDLRASANIIKRTLESFGIPVEMGEINIGPKVTRYTLKPAEGIKLSKITTLNSDLALALAAHPIRIEAPIPGKSLVGIEVPNKVAAIVRLGSLMNYPEFANSGPLGFILGRDVNGDPIFSDIEKMPHALIAGSTGSGKSICIHSLLISLLYKNSPEMLRMILIDPKRVELSIYDGLPHLVAPVITEAKKTPNVFRWAINEMDSRYQTLMAAGSRDIQSYNKKHPQEALPYILIVIDELADLMANYGRDIEGAIVRLAQMARATGIHLIVSTQRPSVEVITGLIKANITTRVALQVASQIDSRTILDSAGAEKLLGGGDMLFVSSELSKPKRIQGAYVSEEEINKVADFIRKNNKELAEENTEEEVDFENNVVNNGDIFEQYEGSGDDDELYEEAVEVVRSAQKASASLLQRRLKVGYARAARLLDIMEAKGIIGPGEGAKPRDVYIDKIQGN